MKMRRIKRKMLNDKFALISLTDFHILFFNDISVSLDKKNPFERTLHRLFLLNHSTYVNKLYLKNMINIT